MCNLHGGKAPQVQAKAQERLLALIDPALVALARIVADDNPLNTPSRLRAARDILDRTGMKSVDEVHVELSLNDTVRQRLEALADRRRAELDAGPDAT